MKKVLKVVGLVVIVILALIGLLVVILFGRVYLEMVFFPAAYSQMSK